MAAPEVHDLLAALSERGVPAPEVGCELTGTGGVILAEAELGWPARRVAVLLPGREADATAFDAAGWRTFTSGTDDLAETIARPLAGDAAPTDSRKLQRSFGLNP